MAITLISVFIQDKSLAFLLLSCISVLKISIIQWMLKKQSKPAKKFLKMYFLLLKSKQYQTNLF